MRNEKPVEESEYLTDALAREAVSFVKRHHARPFFLYLAFNAPHTTLEAPPKYLKRVEGIMDPKRRTYAAMIAGLDDAVGAVMAELRTNKVAENTLVVFLSDNGGPVAVTSCSNGPLRGSKGQVYEGGIRVPFVVSWPARLKPGRFDQPVSSLDLFVTSAAAAGGAVTTTDGENLIPHLTGSARVSLADRPLFWRTGGGALHAVRLGNEKLVMIGKSPLELYDLTADIGEKKNLAVDRPERVKILRERLDRWNSGLIAPKWESPMAAKKK